MQTGLIRTFLLFNLLLLAVSTSLGNVFENSTSDLHTGYVLETGDDALLARLHLMRNARQSIDIQTFIWSDDTTGIFFIHELLEAARRGVKVRILIDDLSLRQSAEHVPYLATVHPNLELKQYNPMAKSISANALQLIRGYALEFGKVNQRMHNKTFIVDGKFGITGGRNYADDYYDRGVERSFKDRDILVAGPVISDMAASFEEFWQHKLAVDSHQMRDVARAIEKGEVRIPEAAIDYVIPAMFHEVSRCADDGSCMQRRITSKGINLDAIEYVSDHPEKTTPGVQESAATASIWNLIDQAEHSITLQTPYLVIGGPSVRKLRKLRKSKPDLVAKVSTNSLAASDHFYAYAYSYKNKKNYLRDVKLQIFEFKPVPGDIESFVPSQAQVVRSPDHYVCVHGKTFVFDNHISWLGTFNLDRRSADLNTEAGFIIKDEELASRLETLIEQDMAPENSWTIAPRPNVPLISRFNRSFESLFKYIPFANIWPFRYSTSYELIPGAQELPFWDQNFHDNYTPVGQFPGVTGSIKAIETRLWKAFLGPAEPIF